MIGKITLFLTAVIALVPVATASVPLIPIELDHLPAAAERWDGASVVVSGTLMRDEGSSLYYLCPSARPDCSMSDAPVVLMPSRFGQDCWSERLGSVQHFSGLLLYGIGPSSPPGALLDIVSLMSPSLPCGDQR